MDWGPPDLALAAEWASGCLGFRCRRRIAAALPDRQAKGYVRRLAVLSTNTRNRQAGLANAAGRGVCAVHLGARGLGFGCVGSIDGDGGRQSLRKRGGSMCVQARVSKPKSVWEVSFSSPSDPPPHVHLHKKRLAAHRPHLHLQLRIKMGGSAHASFTVRFVLPFGDD